MHAAAGSVPEGRLAAALRSLRADFTDLVWNDARAFAFARRAALVLVPLSLAAVFLLFGTGPEPRRDWYGDMLGHDFTQVWVAGRAALEGRGAEPYDLPVHLENLKAAFGAQCRFAWHYPPVFLLPSAAMALLDPQAAFLLWSALSAGFFFLAMRRAAGRSDAALVALAHPLVYCNLVYGQNGLFTAGLMALGAVLVDRRPLLAGLCFGLLAYKPQFAALAPLVLLLTGRRACLAACLGTATGLCLASLALFGTAPWIGFLGTLGTTNRIILQQAAAGLDLNASAFGAVRLAGGSMAAAWAMQVAVAVGALAVVWRAWSAPAGPALRAATLLGAAPLLSPYVPVYDLAPLVPATLFLILHAREAGGLRPGERILLIVTPLAALLRIATDVTGLPFGFVLALATFACIAGRLRPATDPLPGRPAAA